MASKQPPADPSDSSAPTPAIRRISNPRPRKTAAKVAADPPSAPTQADPSPDDVPGDAPAALTPPVTVAPPAETDPVAPATPAGAADSPEETLAVAPNPAADAQPRMETPEGSAAPASTANARHGDDEGDDDDEEEEGDASGGDWPEPESSGAGNQESKRKRRRRKGKGGQAQNQGQGQGQPQWQGQGQGGSAPTAAAGNEEAASAAPEATHGDSRPQRQSHIAPQRPPQPPRSRVDPELLAKRAWKIYLAEVSEDGVALIGDQDARELARRCFRLAEIFLDEQSRRVPSPQQAPNPPQGNPS